jgi:hypothetical protein
MSSGLPDIGHVTTTQIGGDGGLRHRARGTSSRRPDARGRTRCWDPGRICSCRQERPIVLPPNGQLLADLLPRCRQTLLDGGHLIREDAADAYSAQLAQWVHGGYRSVPLRRSWPTRRWSR